ncbi:hypothetical protein OQH60_01745 [Campylobacter sp. MIT 21-1685]|uniref:hypothetical protein n=1 Tax=unclassified Campylobacter TaxID=2593542 RepID=UPI00224B26F4|nr:MULTISPECIES: hypothetical protein [unclassified Campylobacter]MCX2682707.1 hypothetical protein [Campylobacter sp. MIT 21-1684]MCX2750987.1 hypothetical protein [Campylobacter sp. MIT 21-1682]MCX2807080.1 hypothetical protein [Campylobacter sp. MIT 21-1685]
MLENTKKSIIVQKHIPIRKCILCKNHFPQKILHRFQIHNDKLCHNLGFGRSIYLCELCIKSEEKILQKAFLKVSKKKHFQITQQELKEIFFNGKD